MNSIIVIIIIVLILCWWFWAEKSTIENFFLHYLKVRFFSKCHFICLPEYVRFYRLQAFFFSLIIIGFRGDVCLACILTIAIEKVTNFTMASLFKSVRQRSYILTLIPLPNNKQNKTNKQKTEKQSSVDRDTCFTQLDLCKALTKYQSLSILSPVCQSEKQNTNKTFSEWHFLM